MSRDRERNRETDLVLEVAPPEVGHLKMESLSLGRKLVYKVEIFPPKGECLSNVKLLEQLVYVVVMNLPDEE